MPDSVFPPDAAPEPDAEEQGRLLFAAPCSFVAGATKDDAIPPDTLPEITFVELGEQLMLVDLPGYGYAEASKGEIKRWTGLIARYLKGRASLRRVLLLLDARFGIKDTDKPLMKQLNEAAVSFQVVLTKCDLVEPDELHKRVAGLAQ